jgi:hypothetical protein
MLPMASITAELLAQTKAILEEGKVEKENKQPATRKATRNKDSSHSHSLPPIGVQTQNRFVLTTQL